MTIECWVKLAGVMEWSGCVSFAQDDGPEEFGFTMSMLGANSADNSVALGFGLATTDATSQTVCENGRRCGMTYIGNAGPNVRRIRAGDGEWHHWAATYDGSTMQLIVDGTVAVTDSTSQSGDVIYPRDDYQAMGGSLFTIGAYHDSNEYWPMLGSTDEVRIWNAALQASSLCAVNAPLPPSLLGYWKFDEHEGADVRNEVMGGSDGVLVGDIIRVGDDAASQCSTGR